MKIILLIIRKFLSSSKDKSDISRLSFFSYILVALGVAVPILVLSVTNGFQGMVEKRITNYEFHSQVFFPELIAHSKIKNLKGMKSWGFYEDKCLIKARTNTEVSQVRAFRLEDYKKASFFKSYKKLAGSRMAPYPGGIILSENLALKLRIGIGDQIKVTALDHSIGYNQFSEKVFRVDGVISLGYAPYDQIASFILKKDANSLFLTSEKAINKIGVYFQGKTYRKKIDSWQRKLKAAYPNQIINNTFDNKVFTDFAEEKKSLTVSMMVIILIAFIAIFITLNVVLADKILDISLLRVMGFKKSSLTKVFLGQGFFIALVGSILGFFLGSLIVLNLGGIIHLIEEMVNNFNYLTNLLGITNYPSFQRFYIMRPDIFYVSSLPYELSWSDYVIQGVGTYLFALLASFSPALKVLRTNPAEIFRKA